MPATRTGVSTLRKLLRQLCRIVDKFPGLTTNTDVPVEIRTALIAMIAVCLASTFDDPGAGEITGMGTPLGP